MVDYCLVIEKEDIPNRKGIWIGQEDFDQAKILQAFEWEKITDEFISKIDKLLSALDTCDQSEKKEIIAWFKERKGKEYFIVAD